MSYQSKIDFWIFLILTSITLFFLYTLYNSINTATFYELLIISIIYLIIFYIIWLPIFNTVYYLKDTSIEVKSMFFKWSIPLKDIKTINSCTNFISAPALSIKRIEIIYFSKGMTEVIMISPKDREAFLEELNKKISSMKPH